MRSNEYNTDLNQFTFSTQDVLHRDLKGIQKFVTVLLRTSTLYCADSPPVPTLPHATRYILITICALPQLTDLLSESDEQRGLAICSSEVAYY